MLPTVALTSFSNSSRNWGRSGISPDAIRTSEGVDMAKKKTVADRIGNAATDAADAVSTAATGFQVGVLEMAAEEEVTGEPTPRPRRKKVVRKKTKRTATKKRTSKRR